MYAIIQTGGKQYRVSTGERLQVERLPQPVGGEVQFNQVLLIGGDGVARIGTPYIEKAQVSGKVLSEDKGEKLIIYRYKKRKGSDKKIGHRQSLTTVEITEIKG